MATLLNANGDVVSAMLIVGISGRSGFQTRHYIIVVNFYQTKAAFVTERVYRQLLKYYFSVF
jgi:hypothetical protein